MQPLFIGIVAFAAFMYLVMPIVIKFNQKISAHPEFQPIDIAALPPPAYEYLWACQQALESEGFATAAHLTWANSTPNTFPYLVLMTNRDTGAKASIGAFYLVTPQGAKLKSKYVEVGTRYTNGEILHTTNAPVSGVFQKSPARHSLHLPGKQNPHDLYTIHSRRTAFWADQAVEPVPPPEAEIAVYAQRMIERMDEQIGFGRLYLDEKLKMYRPTWKGAYLMTWSQLQPMKFLRAKSEQAKSQAALKELAAAAPQSLVY